MLRFVSESALSVRGFEVNVDSSDEGFEVNTRTDSARPLCCLFTCFLPEGNALEDSAAGTMMCRHEIK